MGPMSPQEFVRLFGIYQGSAIFSVKGQIVNILDFVSQEAMSSTPQATILAKSLKSYFTLYILKCKNHSQLTG